MAIIKKRYSGNGWEKAKRLQLRRLDVQIKATDDPDKKAKLIEERNSLQRMLETVKDAEERLFKSDVTIREGGSLKTAKR